MPADLPSRIGPSGLIEPLGPELGPLDRRNTGGSNAGLYQHHRPSRRVLAVSIQAMAWAMKQTTGSPARKSVLLALADVHNSHTGQCRAKVANIAKWTELGERTVKRALADLDEQGKISRDRKRRPDGTMGVYEFTLAFEVGPGATVTEPGAAVAPGPGAAVAPHELEVDLEREVPGMGLEKLDLDRIKTRLVDGQNLPFNALAEACSIDTRNKTQVGQLTKALKDIRAYFAEEVGSQPHVSAEDWERALALAIRTRAVAYRSRFHKAELTPTALAKWWHQLVQSSVAAAAEAAETRSMIAEVFGHGN